MNDKFERYRTKYLFLLVGENPLPNYVAAKLLLEAEGTLYLIHSGGTDIQAERLAKVLKSEGVKSEPVLLDNESDAYRIQKRVSNRLEKLEDGSVGLHYSGGTKPMAVHIYRTLLEYDDEHLKRTVFSYLSSQRMRIVINRSDGQPDDVISIHRSDLEVDLDTIFNLHGMHWKLDEPPEREIQLPDLTRLFVQELVNGTSKEKKKSSWIQGLDSLSIVPRTLPTEVLKILKSKNYICDLDNHGGFQPGSDFDSFKKNWLRDNRWFELYVLQEIQKVKIEGSAIKDYAMDFKIPLKTRDGFQFDIAFTHGYQLFALSCSTTDNYKTCKGKLLEAYIRAQQMGGSETRVALVCCSDETEGLRKELATILKEQRIKVFGRRHLLSLADEIKTWIRENDMELAR